MIRDLIRKPQKTEHESMWHLRQAVIILFLMILVGSFVIMCIRMPEENPTISTTSIYLSFTYKFTISCWIYYDYKGCKLAFMIKIISNLCISDMKYF